ncbi:MAG: prephenate dehydratase, partial [Bdellovibrionales bacterium]|nr:prephenate dehydratase [Bdellovibrionales bacterium]
MATKKPAEAIGSVRQDINRIDDQLLQLLAARRELISRAAEAKVQQKLPLRDNIREEELLLRLVQDGRQLQLPSHLVTSVFHAIIDDSLRLQAHRLQEQHAGAWTDGRAVRTGFLGAEGSYSYLAAIRHFERASVSVDTRGYSSLRAIVDAVQRREVDIGVLPIENSASGSINECYDILLEKPLSLVGEERLPIDHCLLGLPGAKQSVLATIYSHPQAVEQCAMFLREMPGVRIELCESTADAVKRVQESGDSTAAAIASEYAGIRYGLAVLKANIADQKHNVTRFIFVSAQPRVVDVRIPCKTSIVIATQQKPGALVEALLIFRERGINLSKLESRPMPNSPWEEMFYLDFEGNIADDVTKEVLAELATVTKYIKVLGSYPADHLPRTPVAAGGAMQAETPDAASVMPPAAKPKAKKSAPGYKLVSRQHKAEDTIIEIGGVAIGGGTFVVIAGPCSVESQSQIEACAAEVRESGGHILR